MSARLCAPQAALTELMARGHAWRVPQVLAGLLRPPASGLLDFYGLVLHR